jgi:hypothetical protein
LKKRMLVSFTHNLLFVLIMIYLLMFLITQIIISHSRVINDHRVGTHCLAGCNYTASQNFRNSLVFQGLRETTKNFRIPAFLPSFEPGVSPIQGRSFIIWATVLSYSKLISEWKLEIRFKKEVKVRHLQLHYASVVLWIYWTLTP